MATATIYVPAIDEKYATKAAKRLTNTTPALGPEWIKHIIGTSGNNHDIRVIYGEVGQYPDWQELIKPDDAFFGISCTSLSYGPAVPYIEHAKKANVSVIIGGSHARVAKEAILKKRPGVHVVTGSGEVVLREILDGKSPDQVPGIYSSLEQDEVSVGYSDYEIEPFLHTSVDYDWFFSKYGDNSEKIYHDEKSEKVISVRGINGCTKPKACSFCAVQRVVPYDSHKRGQYLAKERKAIVNHFGEDVYIRDCSDSLPDQDCLKAIAGELNGKMKNRVYCGAMVWDLLNKDRLKTALEAGYTDFLLGLEGFSKTIIRQTGKPENTFDLIIKLLEETKDLPVRFFISGILGWKGESPNTMIESKETIKKLLNYKHVVTISANYLLALPGTKVYNDLLTEKIVHPDDDCINMYDAFLKHLELHCPDITFKEMQDYFEHEIFSLDDRVVQYTGLSDKWKI